MPASRLPAPRPVFRRVFRGAPAPALAAPVPTTETALVRTAPAETTVAERPAPRTPRVPRDKPTQLRRTALTPPGPVWIARRFMVLALTALLHYLGRAVDRFHGKNTPWDKALRLRATAVRMGEDVAHLVEEVAQRIDLVPFELHYAMSLPREPAAPMPIATALERIRLASGRPIEEDFRTIDPAPIVSDAVACTYQAELLSGEQVAIKVLRPDVRRRLSADISALGLVLRALETLTLVRPGSVGYIQEELYSVVAEDLDLRVVSRYQRLFRLYTRRAKMARLTAAKVFSRFEHEDVMVTQLVSGAWLDDVIAAAEDNDRAAIQRHEALGIDLRRLGSDLMQSAWWSFFESPFFQGAPRTSQIVIERGGRIVFVSLRDCGGVAARKRQLTAEILNYMEKRDVSAASEAAVRLLSPLPFIDVTEFTKGLEARLWQRLFAIEDKRAQWVDRTSMGVWLAILEQARDYNVPVRSEVVRMMRSFVLFDGLAGRASPRIALFREYRRYRVRADRRRARTMRREVETLTVGDVQTQMLARIHDTAQILDRIRFFIGALTERVPVQFFSLSGKAAYAASLLINFGLVAAAVFLATLLTLRIRSQLTGEPFEVGSVVDFVATHPLPFNLVLGALFLVTVRRILFRVDDREQDD